jgi:hypothetical protein
VRDLNAAATPGARRRSACSPGLPLLGPVSLICDVQPRDPQRPLHVDSGPSAEGCAMSPRTIRLPAGRRSRIAPGSASFCPDHAGFSCQAWNIANAAVTSAALSDAIVPSGRCLPSSNPTRVDQRR